MLDQIWTFGARGGFKNDKKRDSHNVCVTLKIVRKRETGRSQAEEAGKSGLAPQTISMVSVGTSFTAKQL